MTVLARNNVPAYTTPEEAVKTYFYMYRYARNLELLYETPADLPIDQAPPKNNLKALIQKTLKEGRTILSEVESKRFLASYGIPATKTLVATNINEVVSAANSTGYPVVMKILSPDITHKTVIGGVLQASVPKRRSDRIRGHVENVKKRAQKLTSRA
jgi:acetyltransferase